MIPVVAVVQARMGSARLPGKVLMEIGGLPALTHTLRRTAMAVGDVVLAIPDTPENNVLESLAWPGLTVFRGPEEDVYDRYLKCVRTWLGLRPHGIVVRITGDCPFVDPFQVKLVVDAVRAGHEYASNVYSVGHDLDARISYWPKGLDVEAFTSDVLTRSNWIASHREHVTWGIRRIARNPTFVSLGQPKQGFCGQMRWTLDTAEDLGHLRWLAARVPDCLPPHPTTDELLAVYGKEAA